MNLRSPLTGRVLVADTPHSLAAPGERWPVVDGIAYLRTERENLVAGALAHLDTGRPDDALIVLLADQDAWWTGPTADPAELARLVAQRDTLTFREAMALLRMGPVADYFAYRWVDPTWLAGLALVEAHWNSPSSAFELACGTGHYLRELTLRGVACTGADVVFAKCWLAQNWIAPGARYVVFDAKSSWPVEDERFDLVACHDAFYFLPDQSAIARQLRGLCIDAGTLAVSHLHNADHAGGAKGPARRASEWQALFPQARTYDERALLEALLCAAIPAATDWTADPAIEAWSIAEGAGNVRAISGGLAMPLAGAQLRRNPLLAEDGAVCWPSDRWRDEYAPGCIWAHDDAALACEPDPVRLRRVVDLPERW